MTNRDCVISISNISKSFGSVEVLNNLSFDVEPCIFGLVGPNGAGKTTLIRLLLGLIKPDSGSAKILGEDISNGPQGYLHQIGVLHEHPYFPASMTPKQYLKDVGLLYPERMPTEELLTMVRLGDVGNRKIKHLSAGMQRRLGVALALVGRPKLVIFDEPTSNLDVPSRDEFIRLLMKIHQKDNVSFFLTSHILTEVERTCKKIAFIDKGRIVEQGNMIKLVEKYSKGRLRVMASNPEKLKRILDDTKGILEVVVEGTASIIVNIEPHFLAQIQILLKEIASDSGIQIHGIDTIGTLNDVFRKVISFE